MAIFYQGMAMNLARRTISFKSNTVHGFLFGTLLALAQINLSFGLPLMLMSIFFFHRNIRIDGAKRDIKIALFIKVIWIVLIWSFFKSNNFFVLIQTLSLDIILISLVFFRVDQLFLKGVATSVSVLLILDFLFNLAIYIFGVDPLGRGGALRPGDVIPRVGGLFGHPFYSVNIAVVGIFCGFILRSRSILFSSIINLLMNGTFRSPLTLINFIFFLIATKYKFKLRTIIFGSLIFASAVIFITMYSANNDVYGGNALRVVAWLNSIENIAKNPIFGTHTFRTDPIDDMSADIIVDYGISESTYLQYALDYGVLPMILHLFIIFRMLSINYSRFLVEARNDDIRRLALILSGMIFTDTFYGTLFGSVLTTYFVGLMLISYSKKNG